MRITVLAENTGCGKELIAEHGLSLYIEALGKRILFDMGQSDVFAKNAESLGIDLSLVDLAVLSHGHYDHGGGIGKFLEINCHAPVYLNENAFGDYYSGCDRYIGLSQGLRGNPRLIPVRDEYDICDGMKLLSCNKRERPHYFSAFGLCERNGESFFDDGFIHEHYLLVKEDGKDILISGCSHKGIMNISEWFEYDAFVGGMHLSKLEPAVEKDRDELAAIAEKLLLKKGVYYTGHCTGVWQYELLRDIMKERMNYISTGSVVEI